MGTGVLRKIVAGHDYGFQSVQVPILEYFGRGRDRRCNAIWAMIVGGNQMTVEDSKYDSTDEKAAELLPHPEPDPLVSMPPDMGDDSARNMVWPFSPDN